MPTPEVNNHLADLLLEQKAMEDGCDIHRWLQGKHPDVPDPAEAFEETQRFFVSRPKGLPGAVFADLVAEAIRRAHEQ